MWGKIMIKTVLCNLYSFKRCGQIKTLKIFSLVKNVVTSVSYQLQLIFPKCCSAKILEAQAHHFTSQYQLLVKYIYIYSLQYFLNDGK